MVSCSTKYRTKVLTTPLPTHLCLFLLSALLMDWHCHQDQGTVGYRQRPLRGNPPSQTYSTYGKSVMQGDNDLVTFKFSFSSAAMFINLSPISMTSLILHSLSSSLLHFRTSLSNNTDVVPVSSINKNSIILRKYAHNNDVALFYVLWFFTIENGGQLELYGYGWDVSGTPLVSIFTVANSDPLYGGDVASSSVTDSRSSDSESSDVRYTRRTVRWLASSSIVIKLRVAKYQMNGEKNTNGRLTFVVGLICRNHRQVVPSRGTRHSLSCFSYQVLGVEVMLVYT
jgi:hypothetical protein